MGRPKKADKPVEKNVSLPSSVVAAVDLELYSEIEGRVPHGGWSRLVESLLREWLVVRKVELKEAGK